VQDTKTSQEVRAIVIQHATRIEQEAFELAELYTITSLRWSRWNFWQASIIVVLTTLAAGATGSIFFQALTQNPLFLVVAALASLIVAILTPLVNLHKPADRAAMHIKAKHGYAALRSQAWLLYTLGVLDSRNTDQGLIDQIKALQQQKDELEANSVPLPSWVYKEKIQKKYRKMYHIAIEERRLLQTEGSSPPGEA
jgi:hypothetical protein